MDRTEDVILTGNDDSVIPFTEGLTWLYTLKEWHNKSPGQ
jgi:hypothetical protein